MSCERCTAALPALCMICLSERYSQHASELGTIFAFRKAVIDPLCPCSRSARSVLDLSAASIGTEPDRWLHLVGDALLLSGRSVVLGRRA
jgi:hypothetical protein